MPNDLSARLNEIVKQTVAAVEEAVRATVEADVVRLIRGGSSGTKDRAAPAPVRAAAKRGRTKRGVSDADLESVLQAVRDNPGVRAEGVAPLAGLDRNLVKKALAKLRASGAVRTSGEKRATTYRAAGRQAPAAPAAPKGRKSAKAKAAKPAKGRSRKGPPPGTKVKPISDAELKVVLDVLAKKPGLTSVQIQKEAGIDAKEAARVLLKLRKTKKVKWKGERAAATYAIA